MPRSLQSQTLEAITLETQALCHRHVRQERHVLLGQRVACGDQRLQKRDPAPRSFVYEAKMLIGLKLI